MSSNLLTFLPSSVFAGAYELTDVYAGRQSIDVGLMSGSDLSRNVIVELASDWYLGAGDFSTVGFA